MEKVNDKDLKFLDFILPIFSEDISNSYYLEPYAKEYKLKTGTEFTIDDLKIFIVEYNGKYFDEFGSGLVVKMSIEMKRIIDHYKSLSHFLSSERRKKLAKMLINNILKISVSVGGITAFVYYLIQIFKICNCNG